MNICSNMAGDIQSGDYHTGGKLVFSVANAVQRAMKRKDQYNNNTNSRLCHLM